MAAALRRFWNAFFRCSRARRCVRAPVVPSAAGREIYADIDAARQRHQLRIRDETLARVTFGQG